MGFAGRTAMTVCVDCLGKLTQRQALDEQLLLDRQNFEQQVTLARELKDLANLRLHAAKMKLLEQVSVFRWLHALKGTLNNTRTNAKKLLR